MEFFIFHANSNKLKWPQVANGDFTGRCGSRHLVTAFSELQGTPVCGRVGSAEGHLSSSSLSLL